VRLTTPFYHDVSFTAEERAAYGARRRATRAAAVKRAAEDALLADLLDPSKGAAGYCISFETDQPRDCGPGCPWCDRARAEGVVIE
jgi:hypothetical protein